MDNVHSYLAGITLARGDLVWREWQQSPCKHSWDAGSALVRHDVYVVSNARPSSKGVGVGVRVYGFRV